MNRLPYYVQYYFKCLLVYVTRLFFFTRLSYMTHNLFVILIFFLIQKTAERVLLNLLGTRQYSIIYCNISTVQRCAFSQSGVELVQCGRNTFTSRDEGSKGRDLRSVLDKHGENRVYWVYSSILRPARADSYERRSSQTCHSAMFYEILWRWRN